MGGGGRCHHARRPDLGFVPEEIRVRDPPLIGVLLLRVGRDARRPLPAFAPRFPLILAWQPHLPHQRPCLLKGEVDVVGDTPFRLFKPEPVGERDPPLLFVRQVRPGRDLRVR